MIGIDTNVLVHAHRADSPFHTTAAASLRTLAETERWAIPWPCAHELLAVCTHPRIFDPPSAAEDVFAQLEAWAESPGLVFLAEDSAYIGLLRRLVVDRQVVGPRVHDARIAALCLHHRVRELWSADRDFGRFPELRVRNPLVG